MNESDYGGMFPKEYLAQYWPEEPSNAAAWADNAVLMLAYQEAGLAAEKWLGSRSAKLLDVSTGPALAPLLGIISIVAEAQLSDFSAENRECLAHLPIDHWRQYVPMLVRLFPHPEQKSEEILAKVDALRKKPAVHVDLFQDPPFPDAINASAYDLVSMNFVADSITSTKDEYFRCLKRATDLVRPGGALIMSAIVDSQGWEVTSGNKPSPNVSEEEILQFLTAQGFSILSLARSMRLAGLSYSGGWITLAAGRAG